MLKKCTASLVIVSSFMFVSVLSQGQLVYSPKHYVPSSTSEAIGSPNTVSAAGTSSIVIGDLAQTSKIARTDQQPTTDEQPHTYEQPATDQEPHSHHEPHAKHPPHTDHQPHTEEQPNTDHQPDTDEEPSANKTIELSAHYIAKALKESKVFENFVNFDLYKPYQLFYEVQYELILRSGITDDSIAVLVAEAANEAEWVNSFVWFHAVGYMMADFLLDKGVLNLDIAPLYSQQILSFSESYAYKYGVYDTKSFFESVHNGCYDFLLSLGLINDSNVSQLYHLFAKYIVGLALCCKDYTF